MSDITTYEKTKDSGIEWIGSVPSHWRVHTLYQLVTQVKEKNSNLQEKNLLSLSYGKIKRKDIDSPDGLLPASFDGYNIIEAGDIVLRLTDLQNDHTSLRVGLALERGIITSAYTTLRPIDTGNSKYLYYLLHAFDLRKGFYGMGSGVRQGLNYAEVKELRVVLPNQDEQNAIVCFLDEQCTRIDSLIDETKASIEEYTSLKESIIYEITTRGLISGVNMKDSGIEGIGCVPEHWEIRKTSEITKKLTDFVASGSFASLRDNVQYLDQPDYARLIRTVDLSESSERQPVYISEDAYNFLHNSNLYGGEIILSNIGSVGSVYQYKPMYQYASLAPNAIMLDFNGNNRFFYYWFSNPKVKNALRLLGGNAVQCKFNKTQLRQLRIINPPLNEQNEIAEYLDERCGLIDEIIQEKENIICALKEYKSSIVYETVTGKRKVV